MSTASKYFKLNAILTIAYRDWLKLIRDRGRIVATFVFPLMFVGVLGKSFDANLSSQIGYDYFTFVFTGVLGQILFQSTASGIVSLIEDRENDFSQELFVTPISRYLIIIGKIAGESLVSFTQLLGILMLGFILGIRISPLHLVALLPIFFILSIFGGAFGVLIMSFVSSQRFANQIFPFIIFPQYFLAGVFNPIKSNPLIYHVASLFAPMTYSVDLVRSVFYSGQPDYNSVVVRGFSPNLIVILLLTPIMMIIGTRRFVNNERNK